MKCTKAKSLLSWHLDGNLEIEDRRALTEHLGSCTDCHTELLSLKQMRSLVHSVGRQPAPADLPLKIRLALSREASRFALARGRALSSASKKPCALSWYRPPPAS